MNSSAVLAELVPLGVVTVTLTTPAACGGDTAVTCVSETATTLVAGVPPNETARAPSRLAPVMVTGVPPLVGPEDGLTAVTDGRNPKFSSVSEPQLTVTLTVRG